MCVEVSLASVAIRTHLLRLAKWSVCCHVINRDAKAERSCRDLSQKAAAQAFGMRCAHWDAVIVLEGALGTGSSVKLLDRAVGYRHMPCVNKAPLYRGVDLFIMCLCCR